MIGGLSINKEVKKFSDYRTRHFMQDLRNIMPHTKADVKLEKKNDRVKISRKKFSYFRF